MTRLRELGRERYGLALTLILVSIVFIMATPDGSWADFFALNLQALALFASLRAAQPSVHLRVFCAVVIGLVIAAAWFQVALGNGVDADFVHVGTMFLVLVATPVIAWGVIRQVRDRGRITVHTMLGALCIYLLMSLAFASAFAAVASLSQEAFFSQGAQWGSLNNYLYYSLTTITTVGIGDLTPADGIGRSLTAAEALIGQIYVVTIVAAIVGNLGRKRSENG